ncbi:MAG: CrcB family protein [Limnobacter sp.]|nr:CrcB family protein [Limnobacter sp.]
MTPALSPQFAALVFLGAGLGGLLRYLAGLWLVQPAWLPFAVGTLAVNLVGGFCAGVLFAALGPVVLKSSAAGLFLMTGVLGGLTTFSAFTAEGMALILEKPLIGIAHALVHVVGCLMAFAAGHRLIIAFH